MMLRVSKETRGIKDIKNQSNLCDTGRQTIREVELLCSRLILSIFGKIGRYWLYLTIFGNI